MPSNQTFIIAAYGLTWLVLLGYTVYLVRSANRARTELQRVTNTGMTRGEGS